MNTDYLQYWSLRHRPFLEQPFFHGEPQREAIAGIVFFAGSDNRFARLVAKRGCGTTTLMKHIGSMNGLGDCAVDTILSDATAWNRPDLTFHLAKAFEFPRPCDLSQCRRMLVSNRRRGLRSLWIIDNVNDHVDAAIETWVDSCEEIAVIAGRCVGDARFECHGFQQRIDLNPFSLDDTLQYVAHALRHAGANPSLFTDSAMVRLHERGTGNVSTTSSIAELALVETAEAKRTRVDAESIDQAAERVREFARPAKAA